MKIPTYSTVSADEVRERIAALQAIAILDTPPEEGFDALTRIAALVCAAPIAIVSLIDGDRLWFKSVLGVSANTIPSHLSFCCECANSRTLLEVVDAPNDARFAANGLVTGDLAIRYYAGAPIVCNGAAVGTVCVLDRVPRSLSGQSLQALVDLATVASSLLTARIDAFRLLEATREIN